MPYYKTCWLCGANLDPGEICTDCQDKEKAAPVLEHRDGQVKSDLRDHIFTLMIPSYKQKIKGEYQTNG